MTRIKRRSALATAAGAALGAGIAAAGPAAAATGTRTGAPDAPRGAADPLRVDIVLFDGVEELDVFGPFEVFAGAAAMGHPVRVRLVTGGVPARVTLAFGTQVQVAQEWDPEGTDVIVVPGGGFRDRNRPGIWPEIRRGVLTRRLREAARRGPTLVGVCTGVVLLHAAGLVGTRPCTTHTGARQHLRDEGCDVRNVRVVDDGDLVSAGGVSSGIDGALHLLARDVSPKAATDVEYLLEFEQRGTPLRTGVRSD
ncbi:DJ-1/PfpI family protein [Streptomyces sp. NPDC059578]|uniref:DJ-1/PfpI family protein n=1 Tax=Streptomyces sp. NPDC059578 TaxID=3346874 RepID=UPI0036CC26CF